VIKKPQILSKAVLVLNKNWQSIRFETVRDAIVKGYSGTAIFLDVDPTNSTTYTWSEWVKKYSWSRDYETTEDCINTVNSKILVPRIIILTRYGRIPNTDVKLTKRNLFIRDNFRCQYSNEKLSMDDGTMDHIIPRSRGGQTSWDNVVLCSVEMNTKKGNRTPQEAGMSLLKVPKKPFWNPIFTYYVKEIHPSWKRFLKNDTY
jgi:5-methylcytosine-specific restriction endonuclease McrA